MTDKALQPRTFADTINVLRYGSLARELDESLRDLVHECCEHGKGGSITLTLALNPKKGAAFEITDDIKVKKPKPNKGVSLMFPTPDGMLSRNDPRQREIEGLHTVDKETGEIVAVSKG